MALYKQPGSKFWHYELVVDGKRYRGTTKETRKTVALTIEAEIRIRAREKGPSFLPTRRNLTLRELSERFLRWKEEAQLEPKTRIYYAYGWDLLARTALATVNIGSISNDAVDATRFLKLANATGELRPCSPKYANQAICTLRVMLAKAKEWGLLQEVPSLKLRKVQGRDRLFSPEEEAAFLQAASQPLHDIFLIAQDMGMRPAEIFPIRWENVQWNTGTIYIPKAKTRAGVRLVPMSSRVREALLKRWAGEKEGFVFTAGRRGTGHIKSVKTAFRTARARCGLDPRLVLYSARHTFGTYALEATGNLPAVMRTMGHASVRSAIIYQHPTLDGIRAAIDNRNAVTKVP